MVYSKHENKVKKKRGKRRKERKRSRHSEQKETVRIERLKISVRYSIARGPKCLRCFLLMLSGPVELLFLLFRIASEIC